MKRYRPRGKRFDNNNVLINGNTALKHKRCRLLIRNDVSNQKKKAIFSTVSEDSREQEFFGKWMK